MNKFGSHLKNSRQKTITESKLLRWLIKLDTAIIFKIVKVVGKLT